MPGEVTSPDKPITGISTAEPAEIVKPISSPVPQPIDNPTRLQEIQSLLTGKSMEEIARTVLAAEKWTQREKRHRAVDELTGLYTPATFNSTLRREFAEVERGMRSGIGLTLLDIDDFGRFNKRHGKKDGDEVLSSTGAAIKQNVRDIDVPFREGGEELAVIMPYSGSGHQATGEMDDQTASREPGERLRKAIENNSTPKGHRITVSVGQTDYTKGETMEEFYNRADRARRMAKKLGKNRTVRAGIEEDQLIAHDVTNNKRYSVQVFLVENEKGEKEEEFKFTPLELKAA